MRVEETWDIKRKEEHRKEDDRCRKYIRMRNSQEVIN
jgi:hypothetical protein